MIVKKKMMLVSFSLNTFILLNARCDILYFATPLTLMNHHDGNNTYANKIFLIKEFESLIINVFEKLE